MDNGLPVLVVSCRPENRKMLMRVFEGLPIDGYSAPAIQQAKEALRLRPFSLVFCEERLLDGPASGKSIWKPCARAQKRCCVARSNPPMWTWRLFTR